MAEFQVKKLTKRTEFEDQDRLSQLPDPLLNHILGLLSTEEASRTSVLAKYWRYRWLLGANEFDFNTSRLIKPQDLGIMERTKLDVPLMRGLFFEWVDKAMESCSARAEKSLGIQKLRFQFPLELDSWYKTKVDEWLTYAFAKRVQSLELDFLLYSDPRHITDKRYSFGCDRLVAAAKNDLTFLRSLSLVGVILSKEDFGSILLRFRFLEHLKVRNIYTLGRIELKGSSSAMKHLEIIDCNVNSITVCGTSLVSLTFTRVDKLELENNPKLVSVCVSAQDYFFSAQDYFFKHDGSDGPQLGMLSSCLSRLQNLTLDLNYEHDNENMDQVPELTELKQLTLIVDPALKESLLRSTTLLSLSPNLEKLVLGFVSLHWRTRKKRAPKKGPFSLQHLKVIEVRGYYGSVEAEDNFLRVVFQHIVAPLERIIFDPHTLRRRYKEPRCVETSIEKRAELLKEVVEMGAKRFKRAKKKVMSSEIEFIVKQKHDVSPHDPPYISVIGVEISQVEEQLVADFQVKKLTKIVEMEDDDRISKLPETVQVYILSFLFMEEAARTSILSKYWRRRWLFSDEFNFDFTRLFKLPQDIRNMVGYKNFDVPLLKGRFFEWVNKVLQSHRVHVKKSSELKRLRFQFPFPLDKWYARKIDEWVSYAFSRRVQSLELDFSPCLSRNGNSSEWYDFPAKLVNGTKTDMSFLRSLSLSNVQVSDNDMVTILLKFRSFEHLKVYKSHALFRVELVGSTLALKDLEIMDCDKLFMVRVRDTYLVSLTLTLPSVNILELKNNPKLISICTPSLFRRSPDIESDGESESQFDNDDYNEPFDLDDFL